MNPKNDTKPHKLYKNTTNYVHQNITQSGADIYQALRQLQLPKIYTNGNPDNKALNDEIQILQKERNKSTKRRLNHQENSNREYFLFYSQCYPTQKTTLEGMNGF